jgi:hypothetical protein
MSEAYGNATCSVSYLCKSPKRQDTVLDIPYITIIHIKEDIVLDTNLLCAHCTNVRAVLFHISQIPCRVMQIVPFFTSLYFVLMRIKKATNE